MSRSTPEGGVSVFLHGVKACDTMKKAGIEPAALKSWIAAVGWETLLNRAGTTFRKLPEADRRDLDEPRAIALMLAQPSMIKRPVLVIDERVIVGFKPEVYAAVFGRAAIAG
jgi:arsenate reductase